MRISDLYLSENSSSGTSEFKVDHELTTSSKNVNNLYHLSFQGDKQGTWSPMTPAGTEDVNYDELEYGEPPVPRISVAPTLEQCFRAIYPNIDFYFKEKNFPYVDIFAYRTKFRGDERIVLPHTLTTQRWVWDAHVTNEHWILTPIDMEIFGRYRFYNTDDGSGGLPTRPFNDPREEPNSFVGPKIVTFKPLDHSPNAK